jgi:biofilm protein TabA
MIFDDINLFFEGILTQHQDVYSAINTRIVDDLPGEYPIRGKEVFIKILHYKTKTNEFITESHKEYVDMQIVYEGAEIVRIYHAHDLQIREAYNSETDCQFYTVNQAVPHSIISLIPGKAALFFPYDVHETQIAHQSNPTSIKKAVVKIHVKFFT